MGFQKSQNITEHFAAVCLCDEGMARTGIQDGLHLMAGRLEPGGQPPDALPEIAKRVLIA